MRLSALKLPGTPVSRTFGTDRGTSIDRYWIDSFLRKHAHERTGKSLEVGGTEYIERHFPATTPHRLQVEESGEPLCVSCDLEVGNPRYAGHFDLVVATQVFNFLFETRAALRNTAALLKPGGVMLGSVGGISQISRYDADRWGHYYSFTPQSWSRLLGESFEEVSVETYGNVDTACAYLNGLATEEVDPDILDHHDPDYPVTLCFSATKR